MLPAHVQNAEGLAAPRWSWIDFFADWWRGYRKATTICGLPRATRSVHIEKRHLDTTSHKVRRTQNAQWSDVRKPAVADCFLQCMLHLANLGDDGNEDRKLFDVAEAKSADNRRHRVLSANNHREPCQH